MRLERASFVCANCTARLGGWPLLSAARLSVSLWQSPRRLKSDVASTRPFRVAIVGSGPAGFYAASRLLAKQQSAVVDMYEKLPVPFGLARYGVAPDHPEVKVGYVAIADLIMLADSVNRTAKRSLQRLRLLRASTLLETSTSGMIYHSRASSHIMTPFSSPTEPPRTRNWGFQESGLSVASTRRVLLSAGTMVSPSTAIWSRT